MTEPNAATGPGLAVPVAAEYDGGAMDCGSGLLLAITTQMRRIEPGEVLLLHTREPSVLADLPAWARLSGHELVGVDPEEVRIGPWRLWVRRGVPRVAAATPPSPAPAYSAGAPAPLGSRLWLYSNFHCNLSCRYCCAGSSPQAAARLLPVELAAAAAREFAGLGGRELLITGGEPFLHPDLDRLVGVCAEQVPVTVLTNAMVFDRGRRAATLESMDRSRVSLQISLDSVGPELHDQQRGPGSHARALAGIERARERGFQVRVAATYEPRDAARAGDLHGFLAGLGIAEPDRLIRPVAYEGSADAGIEISLDSVEPEPTLTVDGAWWHPVAVTNDHLKVAAAPLPLAEVFAVIGDVLAVRRAAGAEGRSVFRCT